MQHGADERGMTETAAAACEGGPAASPGHTTIGKRAIRGTLWVATESWGRHLITFIILVVLARLLGPESFGAVALATVFLPLCTTLLQDTYAEALVRQEPLLPEHMDTVFWFLLAGAAVAAVLLVGAARPLAALFGVPEVAELIRWLAGVVLLNALAAVPVALLKREMRFRSLALRTFAGLMAGGVVGVGMAAAGCGAWSLVAQMLVQAALQTAIVWPACGWRPRCRFQRSRLRDVAAYGNASAGLAAVNALRLVVPRFFLGLTAGPLAAGLFQLANRLTWTLRLALIYPVTVVALPTASKLRADPAAVSLLLVTASRYMAMIAFPGFVGLSMIIPELVPLLMGPGWEGAVGPAQLLALSAVCSSVTTVNGAIMRAMDRAGANMMVQMVGLVAMVAALPFVAARGLEVVALVVLVTSCLTWPLQLWLFVRSTGLSPLAQHRALVPFAIATVAMAGAIWLWRYNFAGVLPTPLLLASEIVFGGAVYGSLVLLLARPAVSGLLRTVASAVR